MQSSTTILETIDRALRHPGWAYVYCWHHPPLLALRPPRPPEGAVRRSSSRTEEGDLP